MMYQSSKGFGKLLSAVGKAQAVPTQKAEQLTCEPRAEQAGQHTIYCYIGVRCHKDPRKGLALGLGERGSLC